MLTYKYKIIQGDMVGQSPSISDMIGQSPFNYNLSIIQLLETNRHGKRMVRRMRFSILTLTHKYKITQGVRVEWLQSLGQSTSNSNYNLFYLTTLGMIGGWDLACWLYSQTSCGWVEPNLSLVKVCLNYKFSRVDWQSILLVAFGTLVENGVAGCPSKLYTLLFFEFLGFQCV